MADGDEGLRPYYDSGGITVYNARCEDVLAAGLVPVREVKLTHADPPYGQSENTARHTKGRGINDRFRGGANARARDFPPVAGDDKPFDPAPILAMGRPSVLWGANRYADRLPCSPSWLFWDKRADVLSDDNGDGEMAWSNLGGPIRRFVHLWKGSCRASETGVPHVHPTQKPIALCSWVYERAKLQRGDLLFIPYLGSGPDLVAAQAWGLRVIACDVEEWCCRVACARLGAAPNPGPAEALGPLFGGAL